MAAAAFSAAQTPPASGAVEGAVVDSVTGAGIGGASVTFISTNRSANPSARYETKSDAAGYFRITGIEPGSYRPIAEKDGFTNQNQDIRSLLNSEVRVASGDSLKVRIKLTPLKSIRGRVIGPDGKPAAGIEVVATPNINADVAVTDAEGRFALEDVRPGPYTLTAKPPASAKPEEANGNRTAMVTTYYPSVADKSLAQQIMLGGPVDFDYEIRMQTAPVVRVRGIVLDERAKPVPKAELMLYPMPLGAASPAALAMRAGMPSIFMLGMGRAPSGSTPEATAVTGEDGHFEFSTVRSGDWRINVVSDPLLDPQTGPRAAVDVRVGRGDVNDLEIRVATPFKLTGTIEWKDGNQRVSDIPVFGVVTLINPDGNEFVSNGTVESGRLSFDNVLPGRYKVLVRPGMSAQTFLGDNEVTGPFAVTPEGPRLHVVLKTWSGSVRGTVERGEGATVLLIPQRVDGVAHGHTIVCGAGGSFELNNVSPGDYYIAAFDQVGGLFISDAILGLASSRGTRVKVEERLSANVRLSVITAPR